MSGPPFAKIAWLGAVRRCITIPAVQRLVIEHIGDTADRNGLRARMSTDRVTTELDVSRETVKRARSTATHHGFWVVVSKPRRGRPRAEDGLGRVAEYRLTMPDKGVSVDPISDGNAVGGDPITDVKGVSDTRKLGQESALIGSVETTPSGSSSGSSSVKRAARAVARESTPAEPLPPGDCAAHGTTRQSTSESPPATSSAAPTANAEPASDLVDADAFWAEPPTAAEMVERGDAIPDLIAHYPRSIGDRLRHEVDGLRAEGFAEGVIADALLRWRDRPGAKPGLLPYLVADVVKEQIAQETTGQRSKVAGWIETGGRAANHPPAAKTSPRPEWKCPWCQDTGLVLMADGLPGSSPYACNHDNTRRPATSDEIAEYERRRRPA